MARPLRVEYPGACYHVMKRGNQRATVFHRSQDYEVFLSKLGHFAPHFHVRVFCYCCMPNHFHLYVKTQEANLSRFMQSLLTAFSVSLNKARGSSGHVFQGRFKAHLVEEEGYQAVLSRYIHLNPVRMEVYRDRSVAERRAHLRAFPWSSYLAYIGQRQTPDWLDMDPILSDFPGSRKTRMERYGRYVEEGLLRELASPYAGAAEQTLVGSDHFVDRIRRAYLLHRQGDRREQPSLVRLQESLGLEDVTAAVADYYRLERERLLLRKGAHRQARRVLMYCASTYARHQCTLTELAGAFGVSVSGLTRARDRVADLLPRSKKLRQVLDNVKKRLEVPKSQ